MYTILDVSKTWFLQQLSYSEGLTVILIEGTSGTEPEELKIGDTVIKDTYPISPQPASKMVLIRFPQTVAWQVVSEAFTTFDDAELRDDTGFLQILERSKYFDYVNANHGWYSDILGLGKHYRIWTEFEVIDVIACEAPLVEQLTAT